MTSPGITTDNRPLVGAYGDVYTAPANTPAPADLDNPPGPWIKLGLVNEDGVTWTPPAEETAEIKAWQSPFPVRIVTTSLSTSLNVKLMEWDRDAIPFALGGGSFTDDAVGGITTYHPPAAGASISRALFVKVLDEPVKMGIYYPQGRITDRGDINFKPDEAALLDVTFGIEGQVNVEPYNLVFDTNTFAPPTGIVATSVSAQPPSPGSFMPTGATVPINLAALQAMGSLGETTAWTTGEYVVLGDTSDAYWGGASWTQGIAP